MKVTYVTIHFEDGSEAELAAEGECFIWPAPGANESRLVEIAERFRPTTVASDGATCDDCEYRNVEETP